MLHLTGFWGFFSKCSPGLRSWERGHPGPPFSHRITLHFHECAVCSTLQINRIWSGASPWRPLEIMRPRNQANGLIRKPKPPGSSDRISTCRRGEQREMRHFSDALPTHFRAQGLGMCVHNRKCDSFHTATIDTKPFLISSFLVA